MGNRVTARTIRPAVMACVIMMCLAFASVSAALSQENGDSQRTGSQEKAEGPILRHVYGYLKMANDGKPFEFKPLTQKERTQLFVGSLTNPVWFVRGAASAAFNQAFDTPEEWEQGASGYGKRYADIMAQYAIRQTVMLGFESLLHEDNRYFASGKKGFKQRIGYALSSGLLARHDNGKRYPSASLLLGFASGACISRTWQPASASSFGDAATSFGISMTWNIGFGVLKEFLPDLMRPFAAKKP